MVTSPGGRRVSWLFFKAVRAGLAVKRPYLDSYGSSLAVAGRKNGQLAAPRRVALKMGCPAAAHLRQHKALVFEFEWLSWFPSTQYQGIFVFDEPLQLLAFIQLNGVGYSSRQIDVKAPVGGSFDFLEFN
jgi:hypothetical protein